MISLKLLMRFLLLVLLWHKAGKKKKMLMKVNDDKVDICTENAHVFDGVTQLQPTVSGGKQQ